MAQAQPFLAVHTHRRRRLVARPDIGAAIFFLGSALPVALRAPSSAEPKKIAKRQPQTNQKTNPPYTGPLNNRSTLSTPPSYNRSRLIPELEMTG